MALKIKGIDISRAQTDIDFAKIKRQALSLLSSEQASDRTRIHTFADTLSSAKSTRYLTAVTGM